MSGQGPNHIKMDRFCVNPGFEDLCMRTIFLIGLASGARVSDLHFILWRKRI